MNGPVLSAASVRSVMTRRFTVASEELSLDWAFRLMRQSGDTALAVTDSDRRARGLFALRHFERVIPFASRWPTAFCLHSTVVGPPPPKWRSTLAPVLREMKRFCVRDAMDRPGPWLSPTTPVTEAIASLDREGVNALPVVERGRVVGLIRLEELFASHPARGETVHTLRVRLGPPVSPWDSPGAKPRRSRRRRGKVPPRRNSAAYRGVWSESPLVSGAGR